MTSITPKSNEEKLKVFLEWKKLYTEALVDGLHPTGDVLQIGFGSGFAAEQIQKHHPKTHTIVESNPERVVEAKKWVGQTQNGRVIEGRWETVLPSLGTFDLIFFNDYPLEQEIAIMHFLFPEEGLRASDDAKKLLGVIEEEMSHLTMKFSDQDIEDFYQKMGQFNVKEMPNFFQKLKDNGNISEAQYQNAVKKYHFSERQKTQVNKEPDLSKAPDKMLLCLEECLKRHMNKRARFSSFLISQASKYEDSQFFDKVITSPDLDYKESSVQIKTADKPREGLMMLVEKSD